MLIHPLAVKSTNDNPQSIYVSHIFALAALVLLHTIVSGPWPSLNEIREAVEKSIILLQRWPKICSARGIVWALCILGCTAETPNQAFFDELMTKLDRESGRFGNIGTVLKLMKQYWDTSTESSESWMHTAFQTGTCVLLI